MNRQVNPDHCYETDDGVMYMLQSAFKVDGTRDSPEWHVMKDGRAHRTFTSLYAAKCWLEHVLEYPESDSYRYEPLSAHHIDRLGTYRKGGRK